MIGQMQDAPLEYYLARYRELDPEGASKRTGAAFDPVGGRFSLMLLGRTIYAEWPELRLMPKEPDRCPEALLGFPMQILSMRYLISGAAAPASGSFKAYRELPWGGLYDPNFQGRCIKRFAYGFGHRPKELAKAAESLGGIKLDLGDVSYDMPFLGGVVCRLILWTPDEEFPPSAQFLFSDNAVLAWNAEDLAVVGDVIISALKEVLRQEFC